MPKNGNNYNMRQRKELYPASNYFTNFIEELCEKPAFEKAIQDLRDKWKINVATEIHLSDIGEISKLQKKLFKNPNFTIDIQNLQRQFKLGEEWTSFIEEYIFIDFLVYKKTINFYIEKRTGDESDIITGKPAYYLRIFPETTKDDIIKNFNEIYDFTHGIKFKKNKIKKERNKPSNKNIRDRRIYKLATMGFSVKDIKKYINKEYGNYLADDSIIKAESRYRIKMGIKKGNKLPLNNHRKNLTKLQEISANFPD